MLPGSGLKSLIMSKTRSRVPKVIIGDGTLSNRNIMEPIGSATDWSYVGGGNAHTCGIRAGALYCWGLNSSGQLGDASTADRLVPTRAGSATDWTSVDGGATHSVGIRNVS